MKLEKLINWLEIRLRHPLPGIDSQLRMSSMRRIRELMAAQIHDNVRQSGVLILFYPKNTGIHFVLMLRPDYNGVHGGQISLPGGKREPSDREITDTAVREAHEELGIIASKVKVLGHLTPLYIPPSNFHVTPVVAWQAETPDFVADPEEVAEIIEVLLVDFMNDKNVRMKKISLNGGITIKAPCFDIDGNIIWGATAMILNELKQILSEFYNPGLH